MIRSIRTFLSDQISGRTQLIWLMIFFQFLLLSNILRDSVRGVENNLLLFVIFFGLALGWLLSISPLAAWKASLISILLGSLMLMIRVGRLGSILVTLFREMLTISAQSVGWIIRQESAPDFLPVQMGIAELSERILTLSSRLTSWLFNVYRGNPLYDPVATAIIWGLLVWLISLWVMWMVFRARHPLLGSIPLTTLAALALIYTGKSAYTLVPMMGLQIALLILVHHQSREDRWEQDNLEYAGIIREKMLTTSLLLAVGLMFISAVSPSFTVRSIVDFINRVTEDRIDDEELVRSLGIEPQKKSGNVNVLDNRQSAGLPNRHLIGSGEALGDELVMIIEVEELNRSAAGGDQEPDSKYYWRSLTYDRYVGRGWVSRDSVKQKYQPGEQTLQNWPENYRIIRQKVEVVEDLGGVLYAAGIPLSTNEAFNVAWRVRDQEENVYDIFGASIKAESYLVDSLQPEGSKLELREAGQDYPDWIRSRYLNLPESVPERVLALARDLTATEPTPYDRAVAIETFLRRFPYNLDLPQPPLDQDITEYFLFGIQEGYCDYYASAMVVLARAAGLPARLVTGYIGGTYHQDSNSYFITADLAHAWVEVYFPEVGWIIFEPTGGRPAIDRPSDPIPKFSQDYSSSFDPLVPETEGMRISWPLLGGTIMIGFSLLAAAAFQIDFLILERLAEKKQLVRIFYRIFRYARWIGVPYQSGETPLEFLDRLIDHLNRVGRGSWKEEWLGICFHPLRTLTQNYYRVLFGEKDDSQINLRDTAVSYRLIRQRLWYIWFLKRAYPNKVLRFFLWDSAPMLLGSQSNIKT